MKRILLISSLALFLPVWIEAQVRVSYDLRLSRSGFPDFDTAPIIDEPSGSERHFNVEMIITSSGIGDGGIQGWSMSLLSDGVDVDLISEEGTVIRDKSLGGIVDVGFVSFHRVDPVKNQGKQGVVQAVIPSLLRGFIYLPPNSSQVVGRVRCRAQIDDVTRLASLRYEDGLTGPGQPVKNCYTFAGQTFQPRLRSRPLLLGNGSLPGEEECGDGLDNDQNGQVDCDDPWCRGEPVCGAEQCADGLDNDGDGATDCDDLDCLYSTSCHRPEDCDDGVDDDRDGHADCFDRECFEIGDCPGPEICGENIDNDLDGFLDCDDSDCVGILPCLGLELCDDQIDNNLDGKIDCRDSQCILRGSCVGPEICDDRIDNDRDGLIDCADLECDGVAPCPRREICGDGIDNDGDGRSDCRDADCAEHRSCLGREVCGDEFDNDRDGLIDCDDPQCFFESPCIAPEICDDGKDNDRDLLIDCDDPQCRRLPACPVPEICGDRFDNDFNGLIDCADPDCANFPACRPHEVCGDGQDNDGNGLTDCSDVVCKELLQCLVEDCTDGLDNDKDLRVDCDDFDCRRESVCAGHEVCNDGVDNNQNSLADCADPECDLAESCLEGSGGHFLVAASDDSRFVDGKSVTHADPEAPLPIAVTIYIVSHPGNVGGGVQGWSLSIAHDRDLLGFDPDGGGPTTGGTDAAKLFSGGFIKTDVARDPKAGAGGNGGGGAENADGFVSAVVLSFTEPVSLPPSGVHSVARARYVLQETFGAPGKDVAGVRFQDGLRGSGQLVTNALTVGGSTVRPRALVPLEIRRAALGSFFVRGDINVDQRVNLADAIWLLNEILRRGPHTPCPRAADVNADDFVDLADAMYLVQWQFLSGPGIAPPYPHCGRAQSLRELECPGGAVGYCE